MIGRRYEAEIFLRLNKQFMNICMRYAQICQNLLPFITVFKMAAIGLGIYEVHGVHPELSLRKGRGGDFDEEKSRVPGASEGVNYWGGQGKKQNPPLPFFSLQIVAKRLTP